MGTDLDYSLYYRVWHDESDHHVRRMVAYHRRILGPWINGLSPGEALDIGCGMGFAILALRELGFTEARGIDTDRQQIAACKRLGITAELVEDSIDYLASFESRFQLVTLLDVLEHVPVCHQIELLRAIHRSLAPGGCIVIQVPNASSPLASRWRYNDFTHYSSFTEHSLRFVLLNAGFGDVKIESAGSVSRPRPSLRLWRRSARRSWQLLFWRWVIFKFWRKVLEVELEGIEDVKSMPVGLNITGMATKGQNGV